MVPKPDGTLRFYSDFRRLNEVSEFDGYPMPRVEELLDRLGRARYISTLDLTKGYWQVELTKEAKPKTAFSTPSGHWQYRTLPFGLHGAPATFQRMMDILLRPHQAYAAAYLDDVVVHSERWEDHLERLRRVLLELRWAGLTANPKKCHLYQVGRASSDLRRRRWQLSYLRCDPPPRPSPPDRSDQEGATGEDTLGSDRRGGVPEDGKGHLTPLPLYVCPVYWAYDYTLRVYPLPDVIVFADKYEPFNGSFPRSGFSFKEDSKLQGL
ncbi:hypothetical protein QQF64_011722 [Cirrhinus molitorella]|uniref:ribonuclease H n=1 Tax=Cirrhinus molitorella TaxID=172907 RepID=A0ABR3M044_9TELE